MGIWYCTRDSVKQALDVAETSRSDWQVDDAIEAASRSIEECCNRVFYPWTGTRYLDWPDPQFGTSYTLWLEENELLSLDELRSGTAVIAPSAYNLEPNASGPPYDRIELKLSGSGSFGQSDSRQRDITATGTFAGARINERAAGTLAAAIVSAGATTISVSDARIGVGSLLRVDTERMVVTDRGYASSGQTVQTPLTASNADAVVATTNGAVFQQGEVILVDAEKMRIDTIAGNNLGVKRAVDGSVLADHTGSTIYRETSLTVERGSVGTTAATHLIGATVAQWLAPGPIRSLCRAQAIDTVLQEGSGYARTVGSGDNVRNATGSALGSLWAQVEENYRRVRIGVV